MYAPHPPTTPSFPNTLCLNSGIIGIYNEDGSKADTSLSVEQQFEYYLFTKNAQGDIINIYDKSGQHVVSYTYDAWGNHETVIEIAGYEHVSTANPFRYRGYYFDQETGYYYLNSRYYDCETRRFISPDDISYLGADGGLNSFNLYAYCGNNPVMYVDPTGHVPLFVLTMIAGAIIGFSIAIIVDYFDDNEVFNGSVHWGWYVGATLAGATIGAVIGMLISNSATGTVTASFTDIRFGYALRAAQSGSYDKLAKFATHNNRSSMVGLGKWKKGSPSSYETIAKKYKFTYYNMKDSYYKTATNSLGYQKMWEVNKTFLKQQIVAKKFFIPLSDDFSGAYLAELLYLGLIG